MAHIIELLKIYGVTEIVVTVQYLANVIQDHFGDGSAHGVHIDYSLEEQPLGTAGSVKNAEHLLKEPFLVISGDALTDFDLARIIDFHNDSKALATLTLARVPNPLEYGVIIVDENGDVTQFLEKPSWGEVFSDTVNTGIYVLDPEVFKYIPEGQDHRLVSKDVVPADAAQGRRAVRLCRRWLLDRCRHHRGVYARQPRLYDRQGEAAARRPQRWATISGSKAMPRSPRMHSSSARCFSAMV